MSPRPARSRCTRATAASWLRGNQSRPAASLARAEALARAGDAAADKPDPAPILLALDRLGRQVERAVWYLGDTALDMDAARAAGVTAVLVGDAAHDGGIDRARPDIHFPTAFNLAAQLRALA